MKQFEIDDKIREFVELAAIGPVQGFYPSAVAKYAGIPAEDAFEKLIDLVGNHELELKWELRCPEYDCFKIIELTGSRKDKNDYVSCPRCGREFIPKMQDFFPRFEINKAYKDYVMSKSKKKKINYTYGIKQGKPVPLTPKMLEKLPRQLLNVIEKNSPCPIYIYVKNLQFQNNSEGEGKMSQTDESINDSFKGQMIGQFAMQSQNVSQNQQINKVNQDKFKKEYSNLMKEISSLSDDSKRGLAEHLATELKDSFDKADKSQGLKIVKLLQGIISTSASLMSIARIFGLM